MATRVNAYYIWYNAVIHNVFTICVCAYVCMYMSDMYISDPSPPSFTYNVWCVYINHRLSLSWIKNDDYCAAKGDEMITLESQQKQDRILKWVDKRKWKN